jgi:diaminopimelate decarboxylase/aspartate kinase
MHTLMRAALYDAWHGVHNLSRLDTAHDAAFDVVGPICESSDVFGNGRRLPAETQEGDVLLLADVGAYGFVMANTYNKRVLPDEEVIT